MMQRILRGRGKWPVIGLMILFALASVFGILSVKINFDLSAYLPDDSKTQDSMTVIREEFGLNAAIQVMVEDVTLVDAQTIKAVIQDVEQVASVVWLDDLIDVSKPLSTYDAALVAEYYHDQAALYTVTFSTDDFASETEEGITAIRNALSDHQEVAMRGEAIANLHTRDLIFDEILQVILVIVPICLIILILASNSWVEPLPVLLSLGLAIVFNMGTNAMLSSVSFITFSMAAVLQLAISLDYSLFVVHRYYEEREQGYGVVESVARAVKHSLGSITASAFTTVMGFLSLLLMRYSIGADIGIVMAKGVVFSYLSTLIILPILLVLFAPLLEKTRHKNLLPTFEKSVKVLHHGRHFALILVLGLAVGGFLLQNQLSYYYGNNAESNNNGDQHAMNEQFGEWNPLVILVPKGEVSTEVDLLETLTQHEAITSVQGLYSVLPPETPLSLVPTPVLDQFHSDHYSRIMVKTNLIDENQAMYDFAVELETILADHYDEYYLVGTITSVNDIKETVQADSLWVMLASIGAIGLILILLFRSILIPILLVGVIQTAIWVNFAIPFLQGSSLAFIGYLVVSALQLGATIDYAVLLANRYREFRKSEPPVVAMRLAFHTSSRSILVSAFILTAAGLILGVLSSVGAVKEIGNLLGRGAALSGFLVLFFLAPLLVLFDRFIIKQPKSLSSEGGETL